LEYAIEYAVVQRFRDEEARGRAAGLAAPREIHAFDRALDGLGQVGVGIDDQRVLTAELERDLLEAVRRAACDRAAALDTAYERHDRDQRVRGERFTAFATTA